MNDSLQGHGEARVSARKISAMESAKAPAPRCLIRICRAARCMARGAGAVGDAIVAATGVHVGAQTADGAVSVDQFNCIGLCKSGPNVMLDGRIMTGVDPLTMTLLLANLPG